MKVKRYKRIRKTLQFYQFNYQIKPPFKIVGKRTIHNIYSNQLISAYQRDYLLASHC